MHDDGVGGGVGSLEWLQVTDGQGSHRKGDVGSREEKPLFQGFPTLMRKRTDPSKMAVLL